MYSKLMKGTDVMNQRESYYTGEKRSARPYKKGSTHYLHMIENNAHQIALKDGKNWTDVFTVPKGNSKLSHSVETEERH